MCSCSTRVEKNRKSTAVEIIKPICCSFIAGLLFFGCTTVPETQETTQASGAGVPSESTAYNDRVWLNSRRGVYYCAGTRPYGNTYNSYFLDEQQAKSAGYHPERGNRCSEQVRVTTYQNTQPIDKADPLLLVGAWSGEVYEIKGFPSKIGLQIDSKEYRGYIGHASVIGAARNPTNLPNCQDAEITLETFTDEYYHITFDGEGCDGNGKLRHKENRLSGQARINAVQIFIKLDKEG